MLTVQLIQMSDLVSAVQTQASVTSTDLTLGGKVVTSGIQALSGAGAIDVLNAITKVTTTGANALTLADGTNGQEKTIVMVVDGGDGTLTPTTKTGYTTITFNDLGDCVTLRFYTTLGWMVISNYGCTIA